MPQPDLIVPAAELPDTVAFALEVFTQTQARVSSHQMAGVEPQPQNLRPALVKSLILNAVAAVCDLLNDRSRAQQVILADGCKFRHGSHRPDKVTPGVPVTVFE